MIYLLAEKLKKGLQYFAIFLRVLWIFSPGILFLILGGWAFLSLTQGKDVIISSTEAPYRGLFSVLGLIFWVFVTWYSARLIAFNYDQIFNFTPGLLYHFPRILGYSCFLVVILGMLLLPVNPLSEWMTWIILLVDVGLYILLHALFEKIKEESGKTKLVRFRGGVRTLVIILAVVAGWLNKPLFYIPSLMIIQVGFLFLIIVRRKIRVTQLKCSMEKTGKEWVSRGWIEKFLAWVLTDKNVEKSRDWINREIQTEKRIFIWFNIISVLAILVYLLTIFNLRFAIFISSFPFVLLAFGVLLGFGNIISLLSRKFKINLHFLFILAIFILGKLFEPHYVRVFKNENGNSKLYNDRQGLTEYFRNWTVQREQELKDSTVSVYPVFFVIADGGASRSGYWTASVLGRLEDQTNGKFSRHLFCLSGASGGSVGNTTFFLSLYLRQHELDTINHLDVCRRYLDTDFLTYTLARMLGPDLFRPIFPFPFIHDRAAALETAIEEGAGDKRIGRLMATRFSVFTARKKDTNYRLPVLCINTTRMQDGRPGMVSNIKLDSVFFNQRIDVLDSLKPGEDVNTSSMCILGARFPYVSPAGRIGNSYYVDGGYFDNSGAGAAHEIIMELQRMITDSLERDKSHYLGKIKFYVIHTINSPMQPENINKVHPMINDLAAPVKTLVGSYSTQTYVNNLRLLKYLMEINKGDTTYIPFQLYKKDDHFSYPMNWVISDTVRSRMNQRLGSYWKVERFAEQLKNSKNPNLAGFFSDR